MEQNSRKLIHVPILHSRSDMGSLQEGLEAAYVQQFGHRHWQDHLALIDKFWESVRAELDGLDLDAGRVDLYQDGLPVCGRELWIAQQTAATGSENYGLLMDLVGRGATLMGTEDPNLLLEEYRNLKASLATKLNDGRGGRDVAGATNAARLLAKRDAFIGRRIAETLLSGRTGILFLGMMHQMDSYLPGDIVIRRLRLDTLGRADHAAPTSAAAPGRRVKTTREGSADSGPVKGNE